MIREVVSDTILRELRDPRIQNVTVLGVDVSPDLRYASVRVSVRGDDKEASLTMHGLNSARGFLQSKIGDFVRTRYTPELRFVLDTSVQKAFQTTQILNDLKLKPGESGDESDTPAAATEINANALPDDDPSHEVSTSDSGAANQADAETID
jgi:ribosome-binding factor A